MAKGVYLALRCARSWSMRVTGVRLAYLYNYKALANEKKLACLYTSPCVHISDLHVLKNIYLSNPPPPYQQNTLPKFPVRLCQECWWTDITVLGLKYHTTEVDHSTYVKNSKQNEIQEPYHCPVRHAIVHPGRKHGCCPVGTSGLTAVRTLLNWGSNIKVKMSLWYSEVARAVK